MKLRCKIQMDILHVKVFSSEIVYKIFMHFGAVESYVKKKDCIMLQGIKIMYICIDKYLDDLRFYEI